ncbi:hypothetical protein PENSPDRAFT_693834 [Peniophora sp. CONT]|nr:hypothetical protein PENSPDRAFT_693834 [Peniophora sp. CONT]
MPVFTITMTDQVVHGLVELLRGVVSEYEQHSHSGGSSGEDVSDRSVVMNGGAIVANGGAIIQDLDAARRDIEGVLSITEAMGADIVALQGLRRQFNALATQLGDIEAFKNLVERLEALQQNAQDLESAQRIQADLDRVTRTVDDVVRTIKNFKTASKYVGFAFAVAISYEAFRRFGSGLATIIITVLIGAAAGTLAEWRLPFFS